MRRFFCLIICALALLAGSCAAEYCTVPADVQSRLDQELLPDTQRLFDTCVLSGRAPSFYAIQNTEIPRLRSDAGVFPPTQYLYLNSISWGSVSSEASSIIRDWIAGGGRACVSLVSPSYKVLDFLKGLGIELDTFASSPRPGNSLEEREIALANCIASGVVDLNPTLYGYVNTATTNGTLSLVSGTDKNVGKSYLCAIGYGNGMIVVSGINEVFAMPSEWVSAIDGPSGDDGARFMLNVRQWLSQGDTDFWCPVCSSAIAPEWSYCPYCGARLP